MNYYEKEIAKLNPKSEVITIKMSDYDGNETKYFSLNNWEAILAMEAFIGHIKNTLPKSQGDENIKEIKGA